MMRKIKLMLLPMLFLLLLPAKSMASDLSSVLEVQQYNRAIHIMAMLLIGFGFLMVFVKKYGRSALTATFLLVSVSLPLYFFINSLEIFSESKGEIELLILAEFAAASLLIAAGAVLGRLKMFQYIILGLLFIPFYMLNEWIIVENGLDLMKGMIADTGGSIVIHAYGALFGLGVAMSMTTKKELEKPIEADATSDRYSLLGSMVLWVFWPSFCAALVPAEAIPHTVVNVFLALSGSTLITYISSISLRGKINAADIANAALAGGVAIGSTCDYATHSGAILIGVIAGAVSTFGFARIQSKQQRAFRSVDTCGVTNLHGIPGIIGGLAAIIIVDGLNVSSQLSAIFITIVSALIFGFVSGKIISIFGRRQEAYVDAEEFEDAED
ncbi:MAG: ammonium transporter [Marinilabiliales bacterium]|nr:MAG: ammonium transporter [Marinilabiliales bacterium]